MTDDDLRGMREKIDALIARHTDIQEMVDVFKARLVERARLDGLPEDPDAAVRARPVRPTPRPPASIALPEPPYVVRHTLDVVGTSGGKATVEQITIVPR